MISVRVAYGDLCVDMDFESDAYSPDVAEDLVNRCCSALLATLRHMWNLQGLT